MVDGRAALWAALRSRAAGPGAEAYESLDYDTVYHRGFATLAVRRSRQQRRCFGYSGATLGRWIVTCGIGVAMGAIAFGLGHAVEALVELKMEAVNAQFDEGRTDGRTAAAALLEFGGANALLALAAAALTLFVSPEAAGSGIPEVMAYLNGVHVRKVLRLEQLRAI